MQLKSEKIYIGEIPVYVVHPIREEKGPVIFYHGWSSNALAQMSRAALLAVNGYTVYLPEALHHGERDPLEDYYVVEDYPVFWNTIFNNIEEYKSLYEFITAKEKMAPFIMGHSMGGMTVLGIACKYPDKVRGVVSFNGSGDWGAYSSVYPGEIRGQCKQELGIGRCG